MKKNFLFLALVFVSFNSINLRGQGFKYPVGKFFEPKTRLWMTIDENGMIATNMRNQWSPIRFPNPLLPTGTAFIATGYYSTPGTPDGMNPCDAIAIKLKIEYYPDNKFLSVNYSYPGWVLNCVGHSYKSTEWGMNQVN